MESPRVVGDVGLPRECPLIRTAKELVDRFYGLPVSVKAELIDRFQLLEGAERRLEEADRLNTALMRARDRGQLLALAKAIIDLGG